MRHSFVFLCNEAFQWFSKKRLCTVPIANAMGISGDFGWVSKTTKCHWALEDLQSNLQRKKYLPQSLLRIITEAVIFKQRRPLPSLCFLTPFLSIIGKKPCYFINISIKSKLFRALRFIRIYIFIRTIKYGRNYLVAYFTKNLFTYGCLQQTRYNSSLKVSVL